MKVIAIVQARTGSTRYPQKVFASLADQPLIWHVFDRLSFSKKIDEVLLATTTNKNDDSLEAWATGNNIKVYRGSENNVLERYYEAAKKHHADIIVRITADDPFKDPTIIDAVIDLILNEQLDFAYNNNPPSFPEGLDTEVFTFQVLELAHQNARDDFEREHVTQYFYRNPGLFKHKNFACKENISHLRWTLDTPTDYAMAQEVYEHLYKEGSIFLMNDILQLLKEYPSIASMNMDVKRSAMYS